MLQIHQFFLECVCVWHFAVWHHVVRNVGIEFARYCMNLWCPKLDVTNLMFHAFLAWKTSIYRLRVQICSHLRKVAICLNKGYMYFKKLWWAITDIVRSILLIFVVQKTKYRDGSGGWCITIWIKSKTVSASFRKYPKYYINWSWYCWNNSLDTKMLVCH